MVEALSTPGMVQRIRLLNRFFLQGFLKKDLLVFGLNTLEVISNGNCWGAEHIGGNCIKNKPQSI